jgi:hypothetical protein
VIDNKDENIIDGACPLLSIYKKWNCNDANTCGQETTYVKPVLEEMMVNKDRAVDILGFMVKDMVENEKKGRATDEEGIFLKNITHYFLSPLWADDKK